MGPIDWPRQTPERIIRTSLADAANLRDFLTSALPNLVSQFDLTRLEQRPVTFFSDDWRERETDLLFELPYLAGQGGATEVLVCLLMEHQTDWRHCGHCWSPVASGRGAGEPGSAAILLAGRYRYLR
jgi:hypothetical protein